MGVWGSRPRCSATYEIGDFYVAVAFKFRRNLLRDAQTPMEISTWLSRVNL